MGKRASSLVLLALATAACSRTLTAATIQPNPMGFPADQLRTSQRLNIDIHDMDFPRTYALRQSAYFAVVSRDRLRFHVSLVHKWEEVADVTTWKVRLVDDRGNVYYPETKEKRYNDHVGTRMYDQERRMQGHDPRGSYGNQNGIADGTRVKGPDGRMHEIRTESMVLQGVDVFQGNGDYMFHAPGLFGRNIKKLSLIMERDSGTIAYRFTWHLENPPPMPVEADAK